MWLKLALSNNANYEFAVIDHETKHFVVLKVHAASAQPVYFDKTATFERALRRQNWFPVVHERRSCGVAYSQGTRSSL